MYSLNCQDETHRLQYFNTLVPRKNYIQLDFNLELIDCLFIYLWEIGMLQSKVSPLLILFFSENVLGVPIYLRDVY